jgi:hypothetical protein
MAKKTGSSSLEWLCSLFKPDSTDNPGMMILSIPGLHNWYLFLLVFLQFSVRVGSLPFWGNRVFIGRLWPSNYFNLCFPQQILFSVVVFMLIDKHHHPDQYNNKSPHWRHFFGFIF